MQELMAGRVNPPGVATGPVGRPRSSPGAYQLGPAVQPMNPAAIDLQRRAQMMQLRQAPPQPMVQPQPQQMTQRMPASIQRQMMFGR